MPGLVAPPKTTQCATVDFAQSYLEGADLTGLQDRIQKLDFRETIDNPDPYFGIPKLPLPDRRLKRAGPDYYAKMTPDQKKQAMFLDDK